jgi:hypothetical protein
MAKIEGICKEAIDKSEWIAIATVGPDGPHVVGTWGDYVRVFITQDDTLLIPVGHMHKTEANLKGDNRVELLCGTRQVQGTNGPGKGALSSARRRSRPQVRTSMPSNPNFAGPGPRLSSTWNRQTLNCDGDSCSSPADCAAGSRARSSPHRVARSRKSRFPPYFPAREYARHPLGVRPGFELKIHFYMRNRMIQIGDYDLYPSSIIVR